MREKNCHSRSACRVVALTTPILIPEFLKPLHEFEVILHFAFDKSVYRDGLGMGGRGGGRDMTRSQTK